MSVYVSTVTRKGQMTIPAKLRRQLGIEIGDQVEIELDGDYVIVRRSAMVASRTAGSMSAYRRETAPDPVEEREQFAIAVADEQAVAKT